MQNPRKLFAFALVLATATPVFAYKVEGEHEKGFYVVNILSSAPLRVEYGYRGKVTPQEYLDRRCPGAKVLEIDMAGVPSYLRNNTMVQIVFEMPAQGCRRRGD